MKGLLCFLWYSGLAVTSPFWLSSVIKFKEKHWESLFNSRIGVSVAISWAIADAVVFLVAAVGIPLLIILY